MNMVEHDPLLYVGASLGYMPRSIIAGSLGKHYVQFSVEQYNVWSRRGVCVLRSWVAVDYLQKA